MSLLGEAHVRLGGVLPIEVVGSVVELRGLTVLVEGLPAAVGSLVSLGARDGLKRGEVVGFADRRAIVMLLGASTGVRAGDAVSIVESRPTVPAGEALLGRVLNGFGEPIDGGSIPSETMRVPLVSEPVSALSRGRITEALSTGVRVLDTMTTVARGQRLGIFAGPGVGKSTLLASIAKGSASDVSVIALIGERGREVREFVEHSLGEAGLARSVVFVATSDESPLTRARAAHAACSSAEWFARRGLHVTLMIDSITRFAHAHRQIGLSVGEPPATKGYTPGVFAQLPMLLERAGVYEGSGSITGFYTVLVEGDDMTEPISDAVRGILDGHVILTRALAQKGHFPAVDVLDSVSRLADQVCGESHRLGRVLIRRLLAAYAEAEELIQIGAYARGSNPDVDTAMALRPQLEGLLRQESDASEGIEESAAKLIALAEQAETMIASMTGRMK